MMTSAARPARLPRHALAWVTAGLVLSFLSAPAAAQYQWLDERNQMVFSDLAPPTSIAPERILRVPEAKPVATAAAASDSTARAASAPPSTADKDMAFRKRQLEQAEAAKNAATERTRRTETASACSDARDSIRVLESGARISRLGANGEREYLTDAERRTRLDSARRNASTRCG